MIPQPYRRLLLCCAVLSLAVSPLRAATTFLVPHGDTWRYRKGTSEPPANWHSLDDAALDATWLSGPGGFGYGDGDDATVLSDMLGGYVTVYTRKTFSIASPLASNLELRLEVDYDDAYVAYLDGVEIARSSNVPATPHPYNAGVATDHAASVEGGAIHVTPLGQASLRLAPGNHILAVQGINGNASSSDVSLIADLIMEDVVVPSNTLSGSITADTTLDPDDGAYTVTGDVTVEAGVTLSIEPGVILQFNAGRSMTVLGRLLADGTEADPIRFTRNTGVATWGRIMFIEAQPSLLRHCIVEYSNCAGDHKDYYDDDNNPATGPLPRNYFQAIVALASNLTIEDCIFQNLPDAGANAEGDAIAIISDDLDHAGPASATIRNSRFTGIGQGIHTRYAHIFVEGCFFTEHNLDNDDIDMYGESLPPSLILNNTMLNPDSDDTMNPTRSSAVMIGNVLGHTGTARQGDSIVVLRDRCNPVMINNIIFNANSAGIDVQNTCDALLVNNTIINCGTGINFRDHTTRWTYPYFLKPGAASATVLNCVIWDCGTALNLVNSPDPVMPGSLATVDFCNIEGGQGAAAVSSSSILTWGANNLNANPLFANLAGNDYRLTASSPCIDAGTLINRTVTITNLTGLLTNLTIVVNNDLDGRPRPLDGNGDGTAAMDIGAFEFLLPSADSNGDGIPDGWTEGFGLDPTDPDVGADNPDFDGHSTFQEWIADTNPVDGESYFKVEAISLGTPLTVRFRSSANRVYTLYYTPDLGDGNGSTVSWEVILGQENIPGTGGETTLADPEKASRRLYKVGVALP